MNIIKRARENLNTTLEIAAKQCGISTQIMSEIEEDQHIPDSKERRKICIFYAINEQEVIDYFAGI